ncbi:MAG: biotin carboxylase N-terminal domain-containing protein [Ktedonobacterales bacterium]
MIRKVLVANRGEIACRIMRTCADMGIATVGVFSDVDAGTSHAQAAGEAIRLGGPAASDSYLNVRALLEAARRTGADAIHPGYGFLSENASFAAACGEAGITFIGPEPQVIAHMGSKREAKLLMAAAGIPVVPGYLGENQSEKRFFEEAEAVGYPVMIKASAGGGGKGMRLVAGSRDMHGALLAARRESLAAFGDDRLILEKSILGPRHIEFQIFGDSYSNIIHLGERECTIQRRHQKVVEETPSTALTPELRARMGEAAVTAGRQLNYTNAGTVEFILDPEGNFYFLEVNTRLQVEHPVTELVTGLDLVRWQILIAEGYPLPLEQEAVVFSGHAIEARVYAEDPAGNFLPATGQILQWHPPYAGGVRVDAGIHTGDTVSTYYDPLLAKISAWGSDRSEALRRLDQALATTVLLGLPNNIAFLRRLLVHPAHQAGAISTGFIEEHANYLLDVGPSESERQLAAVAIAILRYQTRPRSAIPLRRWRNNPEGPIRERFLPSLEVTLQPLDANEYEATIVEDGQNPRTLVITVHSTMQHGAKMAFEVGGHLMNVVAEPANPFEWWVQLNHGTAHVLHWLSPLPEPELEHTSGYRHPANGEAVSPRSASRIAGTDSAVTAPMPGVVISLLVSEGQHISSGDPLLILSAMKMEHTLRATRDGEIARIYCQPGEQVVAASVLLELSDSGEG